VGWYTFHLGVSEPVVIWVCDLLQNCGPHTVFMVRWSQVVKAVVQKVLDILILSGEHFAEGDYDGKITHQENLYRNNVITLMITMLEPAAMQ
jgi:hypothetical protein